MSDITLKLEALECKVADLNLRLSLTEHSLEGLIEKTTDIYDKSFEIHKCLTQLQLLTPLVKDEIKYLSRESIPELKNDIVDIDKKTSKLSVKIAFIVSIITALISSGAISFIFK